MSELGQWISRQFRCEGLMQLCTHPVKLEAITKDKGILTRWLLSPTPSVLATLDDGYDELWRPVRISEQLAVAPEGDLFAAITPFAWEEQLAGSRPECVIELRNWNDLHVVDRIVVPESYESLQSLAFSPDGRWMAAGNNQLFLIDRRGKQVVTAIQSIADNPVVAAAMNSSMSEVTTIINDSMLVSGLAFDATSRYLAVGWGGQGGGHIALYRIERNQLRVLHHKLDRSGIKWTYPPDMDLADLSARIAFSPNSKLVAIYAASQWGMDTAEESEGAKRYDEQRHRWLWHNEAAGGWEVEPNIGRHGEVMLYEVTTSRRRWHVPIDAAVLDPTVNEQSDNRIYDTPSDIFFTPDGNRVICGSAIGRLFSFDVLTGHLTRHKIAGDEDWLFALAPDASGTTIWTVIHDQLVAVPLPR